MPDPTPAEAAKILRARATVHLRWPPLCNALLAGADALEHLQAARDHAADLEVYTAELHDLLEQVLSTDMWSSPYVRSIKLEAKVRAALQVPPSLGWGWEILAEVQRLRTFEGDIRAALRPGRWRGFDGPDGVSKDEVIADVAGALKHLDQAAKREVHG